MYKLFSYLLNNIFGLVELLLFVRVVLHALNANSASTLVAAIYHWSDFVLQPVQYIFPNIQFGGVTIDSVALTGMAVYAVAYFLLFQVSRITFMIE